MFWKKRGNAGLVARTQDGELGPFLFGLLIPSTAAFVASHSLQQIFLYSSIPLELCGLEKNGEELAHLHEGSRRH